MNISQVKTVLFAINMTAVLLFLGGCSSGDLRSFNDAMSEQNGYTVSYPNQSDTDYVGDVRWISGVRNGSGFQSLKNTGEDYCKVKISFEDETTLTYNLDPGEYTGSMYMSFYTQSTYVNTLCNTTSRVFNASF